MENLIYILFVCITIPLALMACLIDKKPRRIVIFFIIGICSAVFASEVNGILTYLIPLDVFDFTVRVTPITEEIIKAIPVLFFAKEISDKKETLITVSLAVGIGFAVMENTYILTQNVEYVSMLWAIMRGFGTGIMHGMCTFLVGTAGITAVGIKLKFPFCCQTLHCFCSIKNDLAVITFNRFLKRNCTVKFNGNTSGYTSSHK